MSKFLFFIALWFIFGANVIQAQTTYYSKSTGNLNTTTTWGTNTDGTGTAPTNFTTNNRIYIIKNRTTATISANWTVSGTGSKIVVGDGATALNFTIPSTFRYSGTADVTNSATLTIQNATIPTMGTLSSGSTVEFSRSGNQTIPNTTYYNLTLGGSGTKSLSNTTNTSITNSLVINSGITFRLNTSNTLTCTITGSLSGTGSVRGSTSSNLTIGGTGTFGTLKFSTASLYNFIVNRSGSGVVTMGSALTVSNLFTHINGVINLGAYLMTLNGAITFPAAVSNGYFTGSTTSSLTIGGTAAYTNVLLMDQTSSASKSLGALVLNRSAQTLTLGNDLIVSASYRQTAGRINLNGKLLTISGTITFPTSATNGYLTGSSTSSLSIDGSGTVTNSMYMDQTSGSTSTLDAFAYNRAVSMTLGNNLTVSSSFAHTTGTISIGSTSLTLNGAVTFPASSSGAFTGATTSSLTIGGSGTITNSLFMNQSSTANRSLASLNLNRSSQTVKLGNPLIVSGTLTQTNGNIGLNSTLLTLNGAITLPVAVSNGYFIGTNTSSVSIGGSGVITNSWNMDQTSATSKTIGSFVLNRAGKTVTLGNAMNIYDALTPTAGIFASGGNLTLLASSASQVGRIATIGASGSVTGNVTAQIWAGSGNTGWCLLGSAGITGRTFADWNDDFAITCTSCPNGSSVGGSPFTSILIYNETSGGLYDDGNRYTNINNITDAISMGKGYWVYLGNGQTTTTDIIIDVTGPVNQGNYSMNLSYTASGAGTSADWGYNLIANPYPSPISWTLLRAGNTRVSNAIYVYNPDLSAYSSYVNGVSSPAVGSGGIGNTIPAGQGFYVKVSSATSLTARETNKLGGTQVLLKTNQTQNQNIPLIRIKASGLGMNSETAVYFDANAHSYNEIEYDALSFGFDPGMLGIVSVINDTSYAINGIEPLTQSVSIPLKVTTGYSGSYQISAFDFNNIPAGACLMLHDNLTNQDKDLRVGPYTCNISSSENTPRFTLNISVNNNLSVTGNITEPMCENSTNGSIIANISNPGTYDYYWKDTSNTIIRTSLNKTGADTLSGIGSGDYTVDVAMPGTCNSGGQSFTVSFTSTTTASFLPSATTATLNPDSVDITFSNSSTGADSYFWDFGDGEYSQAMSPVHFYKNAGIYTVNLMSINSVCGDTVQTSTIVEIYDLSIPTGVSTSGQSGNMYISRDANGYYVNFNYAANVASTISVWDLLGEKVIEDIKVINTHHNNKVYVPLNDNSKILIINVASDNGDRIYKKVTN